MTHYLCSNEFMILIDVKFYSLLMAQIVPDVTVVSEIVNIAVAFRSSVWPLQTEFVSVNEFLSRWTSLCYGGSGWGCTLWSWKVAKSSLRLRKNDHRACNKRTYIPITVSPPSNFTRLQNMDTLLPPVFENPYKWIP